jgi:transcription elongation factor Elf1
MKVVKVSRTDWTINCPHCGEYVSAFDVMDIENDEILTCGACKRKMRVNVLD